MDTGCCHDVSSEALQHTGSISFGYIPTRDVVRSDSGSTFDFGGTAILYSVVAILIPIPVNSVQMFPSLCSQRCLLPFVFLKTILAVVK